MFRALYERLVIISRRLLRALVPWLFLGDTEPQQFANALPRNGEEVLPMGHLTFRVNGPGTRSFGVAFLCQRTLVLCVNEGAAFEGWKCLDGFSCLLLSEPQVVKALQVEPKLSTCAKEMGQA